MYSVMTCGGWGFADCLVIRIGYLILFLLFAVINKWGSKEVNIEFSLLFASIFGFFSYWLVARYSGSFQWAFGVGAIVGLLVGYLAGIIFGGTEQDPIL